MSRSPLECLRHIVWDVAARKAPALHRAIQRILDEEGQRP